MSDVNWKTPDEVMQLQRQKQKQKQRALQQRTLNGGQIDIVTASETFAINKRKNPFVDKLKSVGAKKSRSSPIIYEKKDSIFQLIDGCKSFDVNISGVTKLPSNEENPNQTLSLSSLVHTPVIYEEEIQLATQNLPVDWSLKTKLRILTLTPLQGHGNKISGASIASGVTSFVRCTSTGLDISLGARLHHGTLYWQHPNLPWLTLYPRNAKSNATYSLGEMEKNALNKDWKESFQSLFQLLRVRHCPYFYCCANGFTVLFRSAGVGGRAETHAFLTPTTSGLRASLKQEDIEFTMPLKTNSENLNRSNPDIRSQCDSMSNISEASTQDSGCLNEDEDDDYDEEDHEKWLAGMGVEANFIKKIRTVENRVKLNDDCKEDYSDNSIALFEGVECQALFNFLLNAKSTISSVGRLAGIPPTLLAPVAFRGATLRNTDMKPGKVRVDNRDYYSIEFNGVILPHVMQYLCNLVKESKDTFSMSTVSQLSTTSFSKAAYALNESMKENHLTTDQVFGQRNLSDCGLSDAILEDLCRVSNDSVRNIERFCYSKENGGYTFN